MAHGFLTPEAVSGDNFWKNAKDLWNTLQKLKKRKAPPDEVVPAIVSELQKALPPGKQKLLSPASQKLLSGKNQAALPAAKPQNLLQSSPVTKMLGSGKGEITIKQQLALPPGGPKLPPAGGMPGSSTPNASKGGTFTNIPGISAAPKKLDADAFFKAAQTGVHPETGKYLSSDERKEYLKKSKSKLNAPAATASAGIAGAGSATSLSTVSKGEELTVEAIQQMRGDFTKVVTNLVDATKEQTKQQKQIGEKATAVAEKSSIRALAASKEKDLEQGKDLSGTITPTYSTKDGKLGTAAAGGGVLGMGVNALSGKLASKAAGKFGVKQAQKFGVKAAGGLAAKTLGKKIPILGLGLGGIFAAQRAFAGDFTGAGMELASGAASTIPGLGTAGSFGIDAALAARDVGVTPFAKGGIISSPTLSLMGEENKKEGVFPLEGREGEKTFEKFGQGIIDAQKNNKTDYAKIQSSGLKQYYETERYGDKLSTQIGEKTGEKFKTLNWKEIFRLGGLFGGGDDPPGQQPPGTDPGSGNVRSPADYLMNSGTGGDGRGATGVAGSATRSLLDSIAFAEGTYHQKNKGYNTHFGFSQTQDLSKHPDKVITSGGYSSAAFGRYQFMPGTWDSVGGGAMTPERQDAGAVRLTIKRLNAAGIKVKDANELEALLQKEGVSKRIAAALSPEWASFPTVSGASFYGQPVKKLKRIQDFYNKRLKTQGTTSFTSLPSAPEGIAATGTNPPPVSGGELNLTKGAGTFIQGNTGRSQGDHFHIGPDEYRLGGKSTNQGLKDAREAAFKVVKGLIAKGTPFYFSNYPGFSRPWYKGKGDKKSDEQIRNAIMAEQNAHRNREGGGSWGGIDIACAKGTKLPLAVGPVADKRDGFGNAATISGTKGFVAHGASGSRATQASEVVAIRPGSPPEGGVPAAPPPKTAAAADPIGTALNVASAAVAGAQRTANGFVQNIYNTVANAGSGGGGGGNGANAGARADSIIPSWKSVFSLVRR